jgi:hypothetical protein
MVFVNRGNPDLIHGIIRMGDKNEWFSRIG